MRYVSLAAIVVSFSTPFLTWGAGPSVTNYQFVSEQRVTLTKSNVTYRADLVNPGGPLVSVTATVSSLNPNSFTVAPGMGALNFAPVPANSQTTSSNTFTILVDRSVAFDFASLNWTFQTTASPPVAKAGRNQTVHAGASVVLNGGGSTNPSGIGTLAYNWVFTMKPAGSSAQLSNSSAVMPTFVADLPGDYVIMLTVSNGADSGSATVTISTIHSDPVANAGADQTVPTGTTVTLNGRSSFQTDGNPLSYNWTLTSVPPGSAATLSGANSIAPSFKVDKLGNYVAQLVVSDGISNSVPATTTISTSHTAPVADAGSGQSLNVQTMAQLDGSKSIDVDGNRITYVWSLIHLPAGSNAALNDPSAVNPMFHVDTQGTYVAQLVVKDPFTSSTPATVVITTNTILAPTANAGPNQTVTIGANGTVVQLSGSGTDPNGQGFTLTYHWSLVSKPALSGAALSNSNIATPVFTADKLGQYVWSLVVNNGSVDSSPSMVTITTTNTPPVADAGSPQTVTVGATVTLDGRNSSDADHDPLTYSWVFLSAPHNSTATLTGTNTVSPMFVADLPGMYVVQLTVNDGLQSSLSPATVTITAGRITLSPNPLNLTTAGSAQLTITLPFPAGNAGQVVTLICPSSIVTCPGNVNIGPNLVTATATITPVGIGSATILATSPPLSAGSATVNVTQAAITLSPNPLSVGLTRTANGTITLSGAVAVDTSITLVSDNTSTVTVASPIVITAGNTTGTFTATGVALGSANITASATGYTSGTTVANVFQLGKIVLPKSFAIAPGQSLPYPISLISPAPAGGATISLLSDSPNATITPASVTIDAGKQSPATQPTLTGISFGTANITAASPGFVGDTEPVNVTITLSFTQTSTTILGTGVVQNLTLNISPSAPPNNPLQINLMSSNPGVATVPSSITVQPTGTTIAVPVTSVGGGQTTITAGGGQPGLTSTSATVFVQALGGVSVTGTTVGLGQTAPLNVSLPAPAPQNGVTINLSSNDTSKVTISPASVTVPFNATSPATAPQITGVSVGSATINATANG